MGCSAGYQQLANFAELPSTVDRQRSEPVEIDLWPLTGKTWKTHATPAAGTHDCWTKLVVAYDGPSISMPAVSASIPEFISGRRL